MIDLQVLAWQADITRVTTLLMAKELSNAVYPKSGVRDAFHILSHHSNIRENKDRFAVLNRYHVGLLAYLLDKLQSDAGRRRHAAGSLDGAVRQRDGRRQPAQSLPDLPIVLAGGASGRLKGGRHIRNAGNHDVQSARGDARQARDSRPKVRRQHRDVVDSRRQS